MKKHFAMLVAIGVSVLGLCAPAPASLQGQFYAEYVFGKEVECYVEEIYRTPSEIKKRLEFTASRRPTS